MWSLFILLIWAAYGKKALILLDDWNIKTTHASYLDYLQSLDYELDYRMADSSLIRLEKYGEFLYDVVVLACPSIERLGARLKEDDILHFFDEGSGSLVIFGDTDAGAIYRRLANYFGLDFYEQGVRVYNKPNDPVVKTTQVTEHRAIVSKVKEPIKFTGIGLQVRKDHKLAVPILNATDTAFLQNELKNGDVLSSVSGTNIVLAAAFQGNNNARMTIFGGLDVCGDAYNNTNSVFCRQVLDWTLGRKGVLRAGNITHYDASKPQSKGYLEKEYSVNETIHYSIDIQEWNGQEWTPFKSTKVYMEFVMLDPYIRRYLKSEGATYSLTFTAPDKYGVFQFKTHVNLPGYTWIDTATLVPVRPLRHNEYERFLTAAFPYYVSVSSVVVGFLVFSFFFLFHKD